VEQIYSFIDSSQDFRERTPMRLLHIGTSKLWQIPLNSLIIVAIIPNALCLLIIFHLFLGTAWYFHYLHCKPSMT